ncbi:MAG: hypothetical protein ABA06_00350 [Parcubacteria bacterium C7867-001]|nr:MAG: hypothetical protein ABA06_00350 [Parcubacteria bacterium C7867-001]
MGEVSLGAMSIAFLWFAGIVGVFALWMSFVESWPNAQMFTPMWFGGAFALAGAALLSAAKTTYPMLCAGAVLCGIGIIFMSVYLHVFVKAGYQRVTYKTY